MKKEYRPLDMFYAQTDELKKLISEYPDYPIVVLCNSEVVADDYTAWWYAPHISFSIGEILDCEQNINYEKIYIDRDEFEEDVQTVIECYDNAENMTAEEFEDELNRIIQIYEPYWKNVIEIRADV